MCASAIAAARVDSASRRIRSTDAPQAVCSASSGTASASSGPLAPSHQTALFKAAAAAAQLPPIRFHDMRHTAATILLARGVHVKMVAEMLGHSTIVLTLDTYSHLIPAMHGDAAAVMDAVFSA